MRYFVLVWNGTCQILKVNSAAQMSEINKFAFGIPYGPKCIGSQPQYRLPLAIDMARQEGFTEATIDGVKTDIKLTGLVGVS